MHPVFEQKRRELNNLFHVAIQFKDRVVGGIPAVNVSDDDETPEGEKKRQKTRDLMDAWLNKNLADKLSEEEIAAIAEKTFDEAYQDAEAQASTTFKADDIGLYLEGRQVKALLKEAGSRMGYGKAVAKGDAKNPNPNARPSLKQDLHEALHVDEDTCYLFRDGAVVTQPDGYDVRPIHVITAQGPRTSIKKSAFVTGAQLHFTVRILKSCGVDEGVLVSILAFGQDLGLGADRSQGNGKFEVVEFDRLQGKDA